MQKQKHLLIQKKSEIIYLTPTFVFLKCITPTKTTIYKTTHAPTNTLTYITQ